MADQPNARTVVAASPRDAALGTHVPALDGIRAPLIVALLMYHGRVGAPGGFLAVSQFFTLSGFLVMSILLRSSESAEGLDLKHFWSRRYRRLMPASLLTLAGVVVFGFTVATEQQVDGLRAGVPAALGQVANWHFVLTDKSYVNLFQDPSPIQHFWSLAIEEQFYLLAPLLLVAVYRRTRSPRALAALFTAGALLSTAWMATLFERGASIDRLYYGTDTRASEMLTGCVLAVFLHHRRPAPDTRSRAVLGWIALVAYAATLWAFFSVQVTDALLYRGGFLVFSLLTCVVIYGLVGNAGPTARLLSIEPLPALGRITYGVYLFHWPLMLWLTETRTGLDRWPLFGLQVAVTIVLAALSSRYFEKPIRYGVSVPGDRRLVFRLAGVALVLLVAGSAVQLRSVQTDLAGLGESAGVAPLELPSIDGVRVLVIGDPVGLAFAEALQATGSADVVDSIGFECGDTTEVVSCSGFSAWQDAIEQSDPDVVLFHVTAWPADELATRSGRDDRDLQTEWATAALREGFDALTARGAVIAWGQGPVDIAGALQAEKDPFNLAMIALTSARRDVRRLGLVDDVEEVEADLALYARRPAADGTRILVVGDSVARTVGYGLERWAVGTGDAVVWSAGVEGCGIASGGVLRDASGRERAPAAACGTVATGWAEQVATFDPDVVVVVSNAADFRERKLDDWPGFLEPGDRRFDDYLVEEYVTAFDILSADGASVVWVRSPCALDAFGVMDEADGGSAVDAERITYVNDVLLAEVETQRPALRSLDFFDLICPDGEPRTEIDGVGVLRSDGIHFSPQGSLWLARTIGPELLAAARP